MYPEKKYALRISAKAMLFIFLFIGVLIIYSNDVKSQIWVTRITSGQPIGSYYLGDKINTGSNWYFNFE